MSHFIPVSTCDIGVVIDEDLFDEQLNIPIVVKGTVMTEQVRRLLLSHSIEEVRIKDVQVIESVEKSDAALLEEAFTEQYNEHLEALEGIFQGIAKGEPVNLNEFNDISRYYIDGMDQILQMIQYVQKNFEADDYTYQHSINVGIYSLALGKWLGYDDKVIEKLMLAALLHDVGKAMVSLELLNKKEKLSKREFNEIKKHALFGFQICNMLVDLDADIKAAVLFHHERGDGSGYPKGLSEKEIPTFAKIMAIADVYDALTSKRAYKEKMSPFDTFQSLMELGYSGELNLEMVSLFIKNISSYYIGSKVRFKNGLVGEIVFIPPMNIRYPLIKIHDEVYDTSIEKQFRDFELI